MPAPIIAFTRLEVAPATEDLCSLASVDSFLISLEVPPGVLTWISLRGVEGAKNGEEVCFSFFGLGGMVGSGAKRKKREMKERERGRERRVSSSHIEASANIGSIQYLYLSKVPNPS